jgi:hypothetical protein
MAFEHRPPSNDTTSPKNIIMQQQPFSPSVINRNPTAKLFVVLFFIATVNVTACSNADQHTPYHPVVQMSLSSSHNSERVAQEQAESLRLTQQKAAQAQGKQAQATYGSAITLLLHYDDLNAAIHKGDDTQTAEGMRKLDLSQCPPNFAAAYMDHIHAWEDAAEIQRAQNRLESNDNRGSVVITTALQKLLGSDKNALKDASAMETKLKDAENVAGANIKDTYHKVERIAVAYGATLPH